MVKPSFFHLDKWPGAFQHCLNKRTQNGEKVCQLAFQHHLSPAETEIIWWYVFPLYFSTSNSVCA